MSTVLNFGSKQIYLNDLAQGPSKINLWPHLFTNYLISPKKNNKEVNNNSEALIIYLFITKWFWEIYTLFQELKNFFELFDS